MRLVSEKCPWALVLVFICLFLSLFSISSAYADGGAPNLAYVSGTSSGISVIDVGQAKVTRTISVLGDPHTILLSQDGGFLYVSQPDQGQVSIIIASTGRL